MQVKVDHALGLVLAHMQEQSENLVVYVVEMVQPHPQLLDVINTF